jgi:hypothetical protein
MRNFTYVPYAPLSQVISKRALDSPTTPATLSSRVRRRENPTLKDPFCAPPGDPAEIGFLSTDRERPQQREPHPSQDGATG